MESGGQEGGGQRWMEMRDVDKKTRTRGKPAFGAARKVQSRMKRTDGLSRLSRAISVDQGNSKEPPIFRTAKRGDFNAFQVALACSPFHINCTDELGRSPLHLVCHHSNAGPIVTMLLESDADANLQDYRGWTPLHIAAKRGNWAVCRALLQKKNEQLEKDQFRRLMGGEREQPKCNGRASAVGSKPISQEEYEEKECDSGTSEATSSSSVGVDVNKPTVKGATPLFFAVRHGPSVVAKTETVEKEYVELLRCFRRVGADFLATNSEGSTLLHCAAISNNTLALSFLLREIEMEVDATDHRNHTALISAISGRAVEAIDLLLLFGASVSHVTERGRTAYDLAKVAGLVTQRMREAKEFAGMKKAPPWLDKSANGPRVSKRTSAAVSDRFLADSFDGLVEIADAFVASMAKNPQHPAKKHLSKEFASRISSILQRMVLAQYGEGATSEDICWGHVFHKRLLQDTTVWSSARIGQLTKLMKVHLERQSSKNYADDPFCVGFYNYLLSHQQDPDNSLLGLQPEPTLVARSGVDLIALYEALEMVADELFVDDENPDEEIEGDYQGGFPCLQALPSFGDIVARLEYATDHEKIVHTSKALACIVRHTKLMRKIWAELDNCLKVGDLLITLTKTGNRLTYAYMRFSGRRFGKYNLQVYTIPEELMTFNAHITMVLPLSKSLRAMLGDLQSMVKMVDDPVDRFCRKMLSLMRSKHTQVLQEKGLDVGLLHSAGAMSFKLTDSAGLPKLKSELAHLMDNFQEEFSSFFAHMREYCDSMHTVYKTRMEYLDSTYFPARSKDLDILHLPIEYITRKRMACFISQVDTALSRVSDIKKDIAKGEQKRRITDWWLSLIKRRCREFLLSVGYAEDAVPQRYLDEPPKDLSVVARNLSLLQEVLDSDDKLGRKALVKELCDIIYPKIDEFIASAEFTVADLLGITQDKFSLNFCTLMFNSNSSNLGANIGRYISGMMSDLQYLYEIKHYESHPDQRKDPNIVPISSLVLNYFCRALNEHKTVMELWSNHQSDPVREALESIGSLDPTIQRLIRTTSKLSVLPHASRGTFVETDKDASTLLPTQLPTSIGRGAGSPQRPGTTVTLEEDLSVLLGEAEEEYYAALGMDDVVSVEDVSFPSLRVKCEAEIVSTVISTISENTQCEESPEPKDASSPRSDDSRERPVGACASLTDCDSSIPLTGASTDELEKCSSEEMELEGSANDTVGEEEAVEGTANRTSTGRAGTSAGPQRTKWRLASRPVSDADMRRHIDAAASAPATTGGWMPAIVKKDTEHCYDRKELCYLILE